MPENKTLRRSFQDTHVLRIPKPYTLNPRNPETPQPLNPKPTTFLAAEALWIGWKE